MKLGLVLTCGTIGGCAFVVAWIANPTAAATQIVALCTGISAGLGQLATRDFLSKANQLVSRGIEQIFDDGGEFMTQAKAMRDRLERLALVQIFCAVLAPGFAAANSVNSHHALVACAFTFAAEAVVLSVLIFSANRALTRLLESEQLRLAAEKRASSMIRNAPMPSDAPDSPNIHGFAFGGVAEEVKT